MTRTAFVRYSALLTFLTILVQAVWALSMPGFRGPDEPHHLNSVMRIVNGESWPEPGDAMVDTSIVEAGRESGIIVPDAEDFTSTNRTRLLHSRPIPPYFADMPVEPHRNRSSVHPVEKADPAAVEVDQMTQHPPVYYAGGALVVKALELEDAPWDRLLQVLRLYGIFLTIPLVPATIYTARRLGASRHWSLAAGLIPFAIPQLFGTSGVVTNDSFAIGAGAVVVAALAKAGTERISWKTITMVGTSLGVALWSKGLLLAFGLPLILIFLGARGEPWKKRITAALASGVMALVIGWWWILNLIRYGVIQPAGFHRDPPADWDPATADFSHFFTLAFRTFTNSFFSSFGWLEGNFPRWFTLILLTALIAALLWSVVKARRNRFTYVALLSPFVGLICLLYLQGWANYVTTSTVAGVQGRYLFPCVAAFGGIVLGLKIFGHWGYRLFGAFTIGTGVIGFLWMLRSCYPGTVWVDLDRYAHVIGVSTPVVVMMLSLYAAINLGLIALVLHWSRSANLPAEPVSNTGSDTEFSESNAEQDPVDHMVNDYAVGRQS